MKRINIHYGMGQYKNLSNLYKRPFKIRNKKTNKYVRFESVEHAYQSLKGGKFDEVTYQGLRESYIGTLAEFGVPRDTSVDLLSDRFTGLVEGEVSAREFAQRVGAVFQGVQENIPEVQSFYRENFGLELTPEAIFVGALDPSVGE